MPPPPVDDVTSDTGLIGLDEAKEMRSVNVGGEGPFRIIVRVMIFVSNVVTV